jgi:hypothetical protein
MVGEEELMGIGGVLKKDLKGRESVVLMEKETRLGARKETQSVVWRGGTRSAVMGGNAFELSVFSTSE